jgi:rod shape-determining protein MreD
MRALRLGLALVLTLAVQTTVAHMATGNRAVVDLVLALVIFVGLRTNAVAGLLFGSLAGLCQDALSGGLIGVGGLAKSIVGAAAGALATQFIVTNALPRFMVFVMGSLLHAAIFLGVYALVDPRGVGQPWMTVAVQAVLNASAGLLAFASVERLPEVRHRRRMRRTHLRTRVEA